MLEFHVVRTLTVRPAAAEPEALPHLSAASGLVRLGQRLYVVADDQQWLGRFDLTDAGPGSLLPLLNGALPAEAAARKAAKPDFESLALLPAFGEFAQGALLALGSGSRAQRQRSALLPLDAAGEIAGAARAVDLSPLFAALAARYEQLNIEGAFCSGNSLCLLQRGNETQPSNALIRFDWPATSRWLAAAGPAPQPLEVTEFALGAIEGVPLCFTDGAALPDGGWLFCAAAEATSDNYADGPCRGSAVGRVSPEGLLLWVQTLSLRCKAEGIAVQVEGETLQILLVSDADDPAVPALLLSARLNASQPATGAASASADGVPVGRPVR